jgi:hypothetical protein
MVGFQQVDGVHVLLLGHSRMRAGFERRRHVTRTGASTVPAEPLDKALLNQQLRLSRIFTIVQAA